MKSYKIKVKLNVNFRKLFEQNRKPGANFYELSVKSIYPQPVEMHSIFHFLLATQEQCIPAMQRYPESPKISRNILLFRICRVSCYFRSLLTFGGGV